MWEIYQNCGDSIVVSVENIGNNTSRYGTCATCGYSFTCDRDNKGNIIREHSTVGKKIMKNKIGE